MWRRFVDVEIRIGKREMRFYLIFNFLGFKEFNKRTINIFKDGDDFGFSNFIRFDREV